MLSICCWILSQVCCRVSLKSAGIEIVNWKQRFCHNTRMLLLRERGVLAEDAQFMMISLDYNIPQVLQEMEEIRSFHFYRLIDPKHPDLIKLSKRLNICNDPKIECRWVSSSFIQYVSVCNPPAPGLIYSPPCSMTLCWYFLTASWPWTIKMRWISKQLFLVKRKRWENFCNSDYKYRCLQPWMFGSSFFNYLNSVQTLGKKI